MHLIIPLSICLSEQYYLVISDKICKSYARCLIHTKKSVRMMTIKGSPNWTEGIQLQRSEQPNTHTGNFITMAEYLLLWFSAFGYFSFTAYISWGKNNHRLVAMKMPTRYQVLSVEHETVYISIQGFRNSCVWVSIIIW